MTTYVAFSLTPLHAFACVRTPSSACNCGDGLKNLALLDFSSIELTPSTAIDRGRRRRANAGKHRRAIEPYHFAMTPPSTLSTPLPAIAKSCGSWWIHALLVLLKWSFRAAAAALFISLLVFYVSRTKIIRNNSTQTHSISRPQKNKQTHGMFMVNVALSA